MNENTYTAEEVADLTGFDDQKLRSQVKADIAQGRNSQNFNAFQVGNTLRFPKKWIDKKLGIGPVIEVPDWFAQLMTRLGMAVEEADNGQNV
ncbi:MAG: hypothetical protein II605_02210 [Paludibacteraceae bacterium]|nr:hypothetical protein [Paludibacteraceae bacterium]